MYSLPRRRNIKTSVALDAENLDPWIPRTTYASCSNIYEISHSRYVIHGLWSNPNMNFFSEGNFSYVSVCVISSVCFFVDTRYGKSKR